MKLATPWSHNELKSVECTLDSKEHHSCILCATKGSNFDFRVPGEFYIGITYCPRHAEMLKEAQWRHRQERGNA